MDPARTSDPSGALSVTDAPTEASHCPNCRLGATGTQNRLSLSEHGNGNQYCAGEPALIGVELTVFRIQPIRVLVGEIHILCMPALRWIVIHSHADREEVACSQWFWLIPRHAVRTLVACSGLVVLLWDGYPLTQCAARHSRAFLPIRPAGARLTADERETAGHALLEALQHMAEKGSVHRDLKPANLLSSKKMAETSCYGKGALQQSARRDIFGTHAVPHSHARKTYLRAPNHHSDCGMDNKASAAGKCNLSEI